MACPQRGLVAGREAGGDGVLRKDGADLGREVVFALERHRWGFVRTTEGSRETNPCRFAPRSDDLPVDNSWDLSSASTRLVHAYKVLPTAATLLATSFPPLFARRNARCHRWRSNGGADGAGWFLF